MNQLFRGARLALPVNFECDLIGKSLETLEFVENVPEIWLQATERVVDLQSDL